MDFLRRGDEPQTVRSNTTQHPMATTAVGEPTKQRRSRDDFVPKWLRLASVVLLFSLAILALSISSLFYFSRDREEQLVKPNNYQAVFLTNGQVYFGKIKAVNTQYLDLQNIFYLNSTQSSTTSKTTTPTQYSLVKLGCELHGPLDEMVINHEQVSFWENLNPSGKVAQGIGKWYQQNPNGQTCSATTNTTQQSTSSAS